MQVELLGCTSAGKSTLLEAILEVCKERGIEASLGEDFVLGQIGLTRLRSHLIRTLAVDLISSFGCVLAWRRNRHLFLFVGRLLWRLPGTGRLEKLNIFRNVLKRLGIHEIVRRRASSAEWVVLDEGTLHTAHHLFVHSAVKPDVPAIATFAKMAPLPEFAVYLRRDESVLIERTIRRGHKRVPRGSYPDVEHFIKHAVATFENIRQHPRVRNKLLIVDGVDIATGPGIESDDSRISLVAEVVGSAMRRTNLTRNTHET